MGRPRLAREDGFTIIEVMVAAAVLLVGVLGTITLIDTALGVGSTSRSREAATNLGREIVETARVVDYDLLLSPAATAALQAKDGLADAQTGTAGWQIVRRGVTFTVTVEACIYDDPKDGSYVDASVASGYCAASAGSGDSNGDDYRKLTITSSWDDKRVRLVANIVNPAGGFGPRVKTVATSPAVNVNGIIPVTSSDDDVEVDVTTTAATSMNWDAGDTKNGGQLAEAGGTTSWSFTWPLGTPVSVADYTCSTPVTWVPDAPAYQMTFQPFDPSGTPGDLRTQTVAIDRSTPYPLCNFDGGRNPQHGVVVDLQWRASFEGDVVSYSVWRERQGAEASDKLVCDGVRTTECTDTNPPTGTGAINYYVRPKQDNLQYAQALGPATTLSIPAIGTANVAPTAPTGVTVTPGAQPTISWTASGDSDGNVIFYRIYRDGTAIADRYGKTSDAATLSFSDRNAGGVAHTYYVTAVDDDFAESALVGA